MRYWLTTFVGVTTIAMLGPALLGASLRELAFGLAICASAVLYGGYLSLAASRGWMHLAGFALMAVVQIAFIARPAPAATFVAIVIAAQLAGAVLLRAAAVRRWRRIDWLQLKPMAALGRGSRGLAGSR